MDNDDLPARDKQHFFPSFSFELGQVAGAIAWITLLVTCLAALAYWAIRALGS